MKVWAATRDEKIVDLLNAAIRMRWPNSGQLIVPETLDGEASHSARGHDLAIVDTTWDAIDPCDVIRTIRHDSDIPVLVLSNPGDDQGVTARALANGADDYLFKPMEIIELIFHMEAVASVRPAGPV
jgi:DNA-binding response OmpR family regulator